MTFLRDLLTPQYFRQDYSQTKGVFLSVNPKRDFRSMNGFRVPFGKSKSEFLIWWILFEKGFIGFEIRRIQIQINGLVIYAVPFTVDPKLVRWSSGISSWSIPIEAVEFPRCCHLPQNIWKHWKIVPCTLKYPYTNSLVDATSTRSCYIKKSEPWNWIKLADIL